MLSISELNTPMRVTTAAAARSHTAGSDAGVVVSRRVQTQRSTSWQGRSAKRYKPPVPEALATGHCIGHGQEGLSLDFEATQDRMHSDADRMRPPPAWEARDLEGAYPRRTTSESTNKSLQEPERSIAGLELKGQRARPANDLARRT